MKALIIASILFFSLRAMSAEEGEYKASDCQFADQGNRAPKAIVVEPTEEIKPQSQNIKK